MIPNISLPRGFKAAGINSGVRRYRPDLGLILSQTPCVAAGTFTKNSLKAAPVQYCQKLLPSKNIRAILVNSGQANAATGADGIADNLLFASRTADVLGLRAEEILVASTGVIGVRLPLDILLPALPTLQRGLGDLLNPFALSIMTTDLVPKFTRIDIDLTQGPIALVGAAKGSGMIHPNMGTMLGFILTDAGLDQAWLDREVKDIVDETFNMISVDGETSTNDSVLVLANGASGINVTSDEDRRRLRHGLKSLCETLAISIARDGEGASKLITVEVKQASTLEEARNAARAITTSPLIKSAIHGEDPNWGRILSRLGQSGVQAMAFEKLSVSLQGLVVFSQGKPVNFDRAEARTLLRTTEILIHCDLGSGSYQAKAWGCDLTKRYVEINTEYT